MENLYLTVIFLFTLFFLLGSGVWIGLALMGVAYVGMELFTVRPAGDAMITTIWTTSSSWSLTALPLFIWMGEILYRTRLSEDLFKGLAPWMNNLPGRLLHTNIVGSTFFAAVSGSSAATLTTVGKMSIPELRRRNYPENLTIGTLAGSATLGLMIPPSLTLIVYGVTINESIVQLFMAGILPGLVLAGLFMLYVGVWATINKKKMPPKDPQISIMEKIKSSKFLIPIFSLIIFVIGSMYMGWATPTEAAGVGALGAVLLAISKSSLTKKNLTEAVETTAEITAMVFMILLGSSIFSLVFRGFGGDDLITGIFSELPGGAFGAVLVVMIIIFLLGFILDFIQITLVVVPIVGPALLMLGVDPIWLGIMIAINLQTSFLTPPFGFALFYLRGVAPDTLATKDIYRGVIPFILIQLGVLIALAIFPELVTALPQAVYGS